MFRHNIAAQELQQWISLDPPGLALGTEICLIPCAENKVAASFISSKVGKGKWKRGRSTYNVSIRGILRIDTDCNYRL